MEFETVYKVTDNYWFLLIGLIPLVILIFGILTIFKPAILGEDTSIIFRRIISIITIIISLYANIYFIYGIIYNYNQTVKAYLNNDYLIIEGNIQDFIPGNDFKHESESFSINGVYFEYSPAIANFGYKKYGSEGGVLKGNGQYVRLGYVTNSVGVNIIVLIELPITDST